MSAVYIFLKKTFGKRLRKISIRYKKVGCNMTVISQRVCLVVNPITIHIISVTIY